VGLMPKKKMGKLREHSQINIKPNAAAYFPIQLCLLFDLSVVVVIVVGLKSRREGRWHQSDSLPVSRGPHVRISALELLRNQALF
jgi:hypothetical protein